MKQTPRQVAHVIYTRTVTAPTTRRGKRPARRPKRVDPAFLEAVALSYLNRFDASAKRLREMLLRRARTEVRKGSPEPPEQEQLSEWVEELLARYQASGLINDQRYAENLAGSLRRRGTSRRGIGAKLRAKGVGVEEAEAAIAEADRDTRDGELAAALELVRRRRLGHHRQTDERRERRQKDLAVLARAGFSFEVATRALADDDPEDF